jgi:hypothetical protein
MLDHLGLTRLYVIDDPGTGNAAADYDAIKLAQTYALLGDVKAFRKTYQELARRRVESWLRPHLGDLFALPGDGPPGPSRRLDLPLLSITRPRDDSEPDAETNTAIDRWLDAQFRKAA